MVEVLTREKIQKDLDDLRIGDAYRNLSDQEFADKTYERDINQLYDLDEDPNNVLRIMVMLDDYVPGQFLIYGSQYFHNWKSGDIHYFDWKNIPHATANASLYPRPMLVLTGVMSDRTKELIATQSDHYQV